MATMKAMKAKLASKKTGTSFTIQKQTKITPKMTKPAIAKGGPAGNAIGTALKSGTPAGQMKKPAMTASRHQ